VPRPVAFPFEFAGLEELSHAGRRHAQDASGLRGAEECADRVDGSGSFSGNAGGRSSRLASHSAGSTPSTSRTPVVPASLTAFRG
jgi:hypothetical protein